MPGSFIRGLLLGGARREDDPGGLEAGDLELEDPAGAGRTTSPQTENPQTRSSLCWRDRHPAKKDLRPPEHRAGQFHPDRNRL